MENQTYRGLANGPSETKWQEVLRFFPLEMRQPLSRVGHELQAKIIEIRLRLNQPLELNLGKESRFLSMDGEVSTDSRRGGIINAELFKKVINAITTGSFYALEDELTQGFLTLPGGHRVGFTGHVLLTGGKIRVMRSISSINFRIAKSIKGIARPVLPLLWQQNRILKTLIIAAPAAGKTTMLREIIRELSWGVTELAIPGIRVGVVDERSEIAGCFNGVPQLEMGPRTDVLDGCPKQEGVYMLLRSMNPELIATDEIGGAADIQIIEDIINAGVGFIATAHAFDLNEALQRPGLRAILEANLVERIVVLSNRMGVGTIESIKAGVNGAELLAAI